MAFDYSGLLNTADTLIADFGRAVVLRRRSEAPADPAKPWGPRDPAGADIQAVDATGVFFGLDRDSFSAVTTGAGLGESNVEEKTVRCLVNAATALPEEMGREWEVDDGSRLYEIISSTPVKPGGTLMYYDLELKL